MKALKHILIFLTLLYGFMVLLQAEEPRPPMRFPKYTSEIWRGGAYNAPYPEETMPDTGLVAWVDLSPNEPVKGYPMHSGIVESVSDTMTLNVHFWNRSDSGYNLSSYQPDNWFEPVIYDLNADPWKSEPLPEPIGFGYSFQYWKDWHNRIVTQPTVIPPQRGGGTEYYLTYYVWGLPAGRFRVMMEKSENAPSDFKLLLKNVPGVWITKPMYLADTLTAYAACFWRAYKLKDYNNALAWTDSILALNPNSVNGYSLKTYAYVGLRDSASIVACMDSVISILERQGDPLLPDTTDMNKWERMWYDDQLMIVRYCRWKQIYGKHEVLQ